MSLTATLTARSNFPGNSTMPLFLAESPCTPAMRTSPSSPESSSAISSAIRSATGSRGGPSPGAKSSGASRRSIGETASSLRRLSEAAAGADGCRRAHPLTTPETKETVRHTRRYICVRVYRHSPLGPLWPPRIYSAASTGHRWSKASGACRVKV